MKTYMVFRNMSSGGWEPLTLVQEDKPDYSEYRPSIEEKVNSVIHQDIRTGLPRDNGKSATYFVVEGRTVEYQQGKRIYK